MIEALDFFGGSFDQLPLLFWRLDVPLLISSSGDIVFNISNSKKRTTDLHYRLVLEL